MTTPKIALHMHYGRFAGVVFGLHLWVYHAGSGLHLASWLDEWLLDKGSALY
jgi:hypothetical protein